MEKSTHPDGQGEIALVDLLSRELVSQVVDAAATQRNSARPTVRKHLQDLLGQLLNMRGIDLGGARSVETISPVKLKRLEFFRHNVKAGERVSLASCLVWAEAQMELQSNARAFLQKKGYGQNSFERGHLHTVSWTKAQFSELVAEFQSQVSGVSLAAASLILYLLAEPLDAQCSSPANVSGSAERISNEQERTLSRAPERSDTPTDHEKHLTMRAHANDAPASVPLTADKLLNTAQRTALRDTMRILSAQIGIGPLREAARDSGLLGKEAKKADPGVLKRLVPDADQLSKRLSDALNDKARQASALRSLQRIALEASSVPTLDHRAHTNFQRARKAFEAGDWEQLSRAMDSLRRARDETPHPVLELVNVVVALLSGEMQRVHIALAQPESIPIASPPVRRTGERRAVPEVALQLTQGSHRTPELYQARARQNLAQARTLAGVPFDLGELSDATKHARELGASLAGLRTDRMTNANEVADTFQRVMPDLATTVERAITSARRVEAEAQERVQTIGRLLGTTPVVSIAMGSLSEFEHKVVPEVARLEKELARALELTDSCSVSIELPAIPDDASVSHLLQVLEAAARTVIEKQKREQEPVQAPIERNSIPESRVEPALGLRTQVALSGVLQSGLVGRLKQDAPTHVVARSASFLPVDGGAESATLRELSASATKVDAANATAHNLIALWAREAQSETVRPLAQYLEFLAEFFLLRGIVAVDAALPALEMCAFALALQCIAVDRGRAKGKRRLAQLLKATTAREVEAELFECLRAASDSPALARVCCEFVGQGAEAPLRTSIELIAATAPAEARRFLDATAIAIALADRGTSERFRSVVLKSLAYDESDADAIADFLADSRPGVRRATRPSLPKLASRQPLVTDFVTSLGGRLWEKGRAERAESRLNVSVPRAAAGGLHLAPGARHVEVPILVRNGGESATGGVSVLVTRPAKGDSPVLPRITNELHVPWLSDQNLSDTASVVLSCVLELDPDKSENARELRLALRTSWVGGTKDETYAIPLLSSVRLSLPQGELGGYNGQPVDLNDEKTFRLSASSVQVCFQKLRSALAAGNAVRAVVYGRRRRGKTSICESLAKNKDVQKNFIVRDLVWNGARMTSAAVAFSTLAKLIETALGECGETVRALDVSDLTHAEELSERFLFWFDSISHDLKAKRSLLLILDEFQKWVSGLASRQERLALLSAFRHFNDRAGNGKLSVAFVLSGLQSLRTMYRESTDLANAVEPYEIRELSGEESDRYLRERMPIELDGRTRRRLVSLSGGNPYVLNRLCGNLLEALREKKRAWCTAADIEGLLSDQDAQTGRLAKFVEYMLHEDEDDGAPPLRELTVLRATASVLHERGDFDGYVRLTDVEDWLRRNEVEFESGEPARQLEALTDVGLIQSGEGGRMYLQGEWLCRQLAALDPARVKLQPVTTKANPDLVLGRYLKKKLIDQGGEATIWLAENRDEGGHAVVLRIYPQTTVGLVERIEREKAILSRIKHPHVVSFLGANVDPRHGGVVILGHINGQSLDEILATKPVAAQSILPGGDLPSQVELMLKMADAVASLHAVSVVHKDLAPKNVMMAQQLGVWEPTLIDFGIAGFDTQPLRDETTVMGTPGYVAPEKLRGARRSMAADIYSLGALFLNLTTGVVPSEVAGSSESIRVALSSPALPKRLKELVLRMLSQEPKERPSAAEVREELKTALQPETWLEFRAAAFDALCDDRFEDAASLYGAALSAVPSMERTGREFGELLCEAMEALARCPIIVPWAETWLVQSHNFMRSNVGGPKGKALLDALEAYRGRFRDAGSRLFVRLVQDLAQSAPTPGDAELLLAIARIALVRDVEFAPWMFEALARFCVEGLVDLSAVEDFSIICARDSRVRLQQPLVAELWLQRVRRFGGGPRADYDAEAKALADARKRTGKVQTLPEATKQETMKLGVGERGHLHVDMIEAFDERVRGLFPFVVRLERVRKDGNLKGSRPTLLRLENIGRHVHQGATDPGNIIPFFLDGSYSPDRCALRMNLVLAKSATPTQRQAAFDVLRAAGDVFDIGE